MTGLTAAFAAIDEANADDPTRHGDEPLALVQGRRAEAWVTELAPGASDALRLAARAHHLRRWAVPRASYPGGRAGYLLWRRDQKARHAEELTALLAPLGLDPAVIERAAEIVRKRGLGTDPEVQVFEDAVCLTFLETQFSTTTDRLADDEKMVDVVAKTLRKMSPAGHEAAATIRLDERLEGIVGRAAAMLAG